MSDGYLKKKFYPGNDRGRYGLFFNQLNSIKINHAENYWKVQMDDLFVDFFSYYDQLSRQAGDQSFEIRFVGRTALE
jgi:hypothetical protein